MGGTMRWEKKHVLYVAIIAVVVVVGFVLLGSLALRFVASNYIQGNLKNLTADSSAGQYLSYSVGIPLSFLAAVVAAVIGVWITNKINEYTKSKDDFAILDFVDNVSSTVCEAQGDIARAFSTFNEIAVEMARGVEAVLQKFSIDDDNNTDSNDNRRYEQMRDELSRQQAENFIKFNQALAKISAQYENLTSHMHCTLFLKQHLDTEKENLPIAHFKRVLPPEVLRHIMPEEADTPISSTTLRTMAASLIWMCEHTDAIELVAAYFQLPQTFLRIEFAGMVLFSPRFELDKPVTLPNGTVVDSFVVNVGGAYLTSLYASLPDKNDMLRAFGQLLENKMPDVADRYLKMAGPKMSELALPHIESAVQDILQNQNRLIVLLTDDGAEFYDRAAHGDIGQWQLKLEDEQ